MATAKAASVMGATLGMRTRSLFRAGSPAGNRLGRRQAWRGRCDAKRLSTGRNCHTWSRVAPCGTASCPREYDGEPASHRRRNVALSNRRWHTARHRNVRQDCVTGFFARDLSLRITARCGPQMAPLVFVSVPSRAAAASSATCSVCIHVTRMDSDSMLWDYMRN